jgi:hypothetical protein
VSGHSSAPGGKWGAPGAQGRASTTAVARAQWLATEVWRVPVWPQYQNTLRYYRLQLHHISPCILNFTVLSPLRIIPESRLGKGEKGMHWKTLLELITMSVDKELQLRNAYLETEHRLLRKQITSRVPLTNDDRRALAELGQKLGKQVLEEIATAASGALYLVRVGGSRSDRSCQHRDHPSHRAGRLFLRIGQVKSGSSAGHRSSLGRRPPWGAQRQRGSHARPRLEPCTG